MNRNYRIIFKWLSYVLFLTALAVIQTSLLPNLKLFGASPNLLPIAATMVAVLEGGVPGALFGLLAGLYCDAIIPKVDVLHTVYLFVSGLVIGQLVAALFKKNLVTAALCAIASLAVLDFFLMLLFFIVPRRAGISSLLQVALPEILFSAILSPLVYGPIRWANKRWGEEEEE
ncbi:MAG: rod shape-determining protein MreD [Oscillospiraceae bacterium]|nr:rod shape-determining protein MreD [Oscillospiraceae bacterium]